MRDLPTILHELNLLVDELKEQNISSVFAITQYGKIPEHTRFDARVSLCPVPELGVDATHAFCDIQRELINLWDEQAHKR